MWTSAQSGTRTRAGAAVLLHQGAAPGVGVLRLHLGQHDGRRVHQVRATSPIQSKTVNGHEWAKRQATAAGIGFTALSNGFASCQDPAALQAIYNRFGPGHRQVWFERWMAKIPLPLDDADRNAGYWWGLNAAGGSLPGPRLVFDDNIHARAFFEALLCRSIWTWAARRTSYYSARGKRSSSDKQAAAGRGVQDQDRPVLRSGHAERVL